MGFAHNLFSQGSDNTYKKTSMCGSTCIPFPLSTFTFSLSLHIPDPGLDDRQRGRAGGFGAQDARAQ